MDFLSLITTYINSDLPVMALASTAATTAAEPVSGVSSVAKLIAEFGIMVVIAAMMMFFMWKYMNNVIKRDNKLFEELSPKLTEVQTSAANDMHQIVATLKDVDAHLSLLITNHNAHTNETIGAMERDQEDMRDLLLQCQDTLKDVSGQLTAVINNINMIFQVLMTNYGQRPPQTTGNGNNAPTGGSDGDGDKK